MKILVTGGAGFIGSNLVKQLVGQGYSVRVLHLPGENLSNLNGVDVELVSGNVMDVKSVESAVKDCQKVFHLAAIYALWMPEPKLMMDVNVRGSQNVFDACLKYDVEKVVHTSSLVRFGGQGKNKVATEESPFRLGVTKDQYSISKYQSHILAESYAINKGLNLTIVCPALPIGPGDIGPTPTGKYVIYTLTNPVVFHPETNTNIGDVRDIANGHILAMEKGERGRSYILGGLQNISMKDFSQLCRKIADKSGILITAPQPILEASAFMMQLYSILVSRKAPLMTYESAKATKLGLMADCSRAVNELGYHCRPLSESLTDAMTWFQTNGYLD